jgi:hypothetical protein
MLRYDWHDILERALWTAIQAFASAIPAGFALTDLGTLKIAAVAGITAGIGFLLSTLKNLAKQRLEEV